MVNIKVKDKVNGVVFLLGVCCSVNFLDVKIDRDLGLVKIRINSLK